MNSIESNDQKPVAESSVTGNAPNTQLNQSTKPEVRKKNYDYIIWYSLLVLATAAIFFVVIARLNRKAPKPDPVIVQSNATKATSINDFANVCKDKQIENVGSYSGDNPHPIVLMKDDVNNKNEYSVPNITLSDSGWQAKSDDYLSTQLVGCIHLIKEQKSGNNCQFTNTSGNVVSLPLYNADYTFKVYDAKTGTLQGSNELKADTSKCPTFATYSDENPKLYSDIDKTQLNEVVRKYVNHED